ncbi:MAG: hypothetical protein ACI4DK_12765 [Lachnospiraceae bacterium]
MNVTKIKIKNLFGIKEYEADGSSLELSGKNGVGKSSVIDAIRYALTNKSNREYIVRKGENEGEIIVETDTGLTIDRKVRMGMTDYKSVKQNGQEVRSPEAFLRDIFTSLQLNPVEFMNMDAKQQNAQILDMIEYPWNMDTIREWFGEIPSWVNYEQNILCVLNDIQAENGVYFQNRQDINRDIRNKRAFIEEISASIPDGYQVEKWEKADVGKIYKEIERQQKENQEIQKAKQVIENKDNKVRKFDADRQIDISILETEISNREGQIDKDIIRLQEQIKALQVEKDGLAAKKEDKLEVINKTYKANVAEFEAECKEYEKYAGAELKDTSDLSKQAEEIEQMKSHINEYRRMQRLQEEVADLQAESQRLTDKIEKARTLPGEILENCTIPIEGLTVQNGIPLINGLPISNLSDGQKLDLCVDVAIQKPNGLQIILIDGVEKLATDMREKLYQKCKDKGLQFIATRTTDDPDLTVVEL